LAPEIVRNEAFKKCDEEKWDECLKDLNRAARVDPEGDHTGAVRDARTKAADGRVRQLLEEKKRMLQRSGQP
jgi:hypothetical protein